MNHSRRWSTTGVHYRNDWQHIIASLAVWNIDTYSATLELSVYSKSRILSYCGPHGRSCWSVVTMLSYQAPLWEAVHMLFSPLSGLHWIPDDTFDGQETSERTALWCNQDLEHTFAHFRGHVIWNGGDPFENGTFCSQVPLDLCHGVLKV